MSYTQSVLTELRADIVTMRDFYSERDAASRMALGNVLNLIDDLLPPKALPCPFCGSTELWIPELGAPDHRPVAGCQGCGALAPVRNVDWNTRVQP